MERKEILLRKIANTIVANVNHYTKIKRNVGKHCNKKMAKIMKAVYKEKYLI